jgi:hypothetical protein
LSPSFSLAVIMVFDPINGINERRDCSDCKGWPATHDD